MFCWTMYFRQCRSLISYILDQQITSSPPSSPMIYSGNESFKKISTSPGRAPLVPVAGSSSIEACRIQRSSSGGRCPDDKRSDLLIFDGSEKSHGRLGLTKIPHSYVGDVPFPTELRIPGVSVVGLVAGGMYAPPIIISYSLP